MKIVTITIVLAFSFAQANPRSAARPTLAKADVIGAGVYGAYEVGTLKRKFISNGSFMNSNYNFDEWNGWRQEDGFLCRTNNDCSWIDPQMFCQDYELEFKPSVIRKKVFL